MKVAADHLRVQLSHFAVDISNNGFPLYEV